MLKQVSSKKSKTDADYDEIMRIEWYACLYLNEENKLIIPSFMLEASFVNGAKKNRLGKQAQAGLFVESHSPLNFDGDNLSVDELWERDKNRLTVPCRIQSSKVVKTRFKVDQWSTNVKVTFDDSLLTQSQVVDIVRTTGEVVAIGTWRPKFGRYIAEEVG